MNFDKLADELSKLYADIKAQKVDLGTAHELNNTAANIQGVVRLCLLNAKMRGETPSLAFFGKARRAAVKKGGA